MARQVFRVVAALVLCLPIVRVITLTFGSEQKVDRTGPEWKAREALIGRAQVFVKTPVKLDSFTPSDIIECRYIPKPVRATTPKFDCRLPDDTVIKVKYGRTPERQGEVAATQLLSALGFGADHAQTAETVRCLGCPPFPFQARILADWFFAGPLLDALVDDGVSREFKWVSVERKMPGAAVEVGPYEGWEWHELGLVDAGKGGATAAEIDAFRLMAVFLAHWDNKAENQRLVCRAGEDPLKSCDAPLLMIQDVGATFGPTKVNYSGWSATPIWSNAATCAVSLEELPFEGGSFEPVNISEAGRALLAGKLKQLSVQQIRSMFEAARFPDPVTGVEGGDVRLWVGTFQDKVRQIADRPACPK